MATTTFSACFTSFERNRLQEELGVNGYAALKRTPDEIGYISLNDKREFANDKSQMSYLETDKNRSNEMDLNDGYLDRFIKRDYNYRDGLESLLRWINLNFDRAHNPHDEIGEAGSKLPETMPDFIMPRGNMAKIMCTPYENDEGWIMVARKFGSTIYITEKETSESTDCQRNETAEKEYWGFRFEKYMTRPDPPSHGSKPVDQSKVTVNTNATFRTVLTLHLNTHSVIYSGEVDCYKEPGLDARGHYVELKTKRQFSSDKQKQNFYRYNTKKWWAQSYLAIVPQIICGFKNESGIVVRNRIADFKTADLPKMVPPGGWDKLVMLLFLNKFFDEVKKAFRKCPRSSLIMFSFDPSYKKVDVKAGDLLQEDDILPEWYIASLEAKKGIDLPITTRKTT